MKEKVSKIIKNPKIDWNYVVIGLITKEGLSSKELTKLLGVSHSTLSNWLNFHASLSSENKIRLYGIIFKLKLNIFRLEEIGKINYKIIIDSIKKEMGIGCNLIASSLRITPSLIDSYSKGIIPRAKNKNLLLKFYQKIKKEEDKRKIIRQIYERSFLNNKYGMILKGIRNYFELNFNETSKIVGLNSKCLNSYEKGHLRLSKNVFNKIYQKLLKFKINKQEVLRGIREEKNKWIKSRPYHEIINFIQENSTGSKFELEVYKKLKTINLFKEIFLGPILSNKDLTTKFKADIYAIDNNNKCYLIEVKQHKYYSMADEIKSCALIKNKIKEIDELIIITQKNHPLITKHFREIGIHVIDINRVENLNEILKGNNTERIDTKLEKVRKRLNLSRHQLAALLDVNDRSIRNWENLKYKSRIDINKKLDHLQDIAKIHSSYYLQFKANKLLITRNINNLKLRLLRTELNITQRELAKRIGVSREILQKFEQGKYRSIILKRKIWKVLKESCNSKNEFDNSIRITEINCLKYLRYWKLAENVKNVINIIPEYKNKGLEFETRVERYFKTLGYETIRNVIFSDNKGRWYTEVDIVAISPHNEIKIISCVKSNVNTSYKRINELRFVGDMVDIKNLILVCGDKNSTQIIDKSHNLGVEIIDNFNAFSGSHKYAQSPLV